MTLYTLGIVYDAYMAPNAMVTTFDQADDFAQWLGHEHDYKLA